MQTCETCKFWKPENVSESSWTLDRDFVGFGECGLVVEYEGVNSWPPSLDHIYVMFEDGLAGPDLYTGSEFGCIHWQQREDST